MKKLSQQRFGYRGRSHTKSLYLSLDDEQFECCRLEVFSKADSLKFNMENLKLIFKFVFFICTFLIPISSTTVIEKININDRPIIGKFQNICCDYSK